MAAGGGQQLPSAFQRTAMKFLNELRTEIEQEHEALAKPIEDYENKKHHLRLTSLDNATYRVYVGFIDQPEIPFRRGQVLWIYWPTLPIYHVVGRSPTTSTNSPEHNRKAKLHDHDRDDGYELLVQVTNPAKKTDEAIVRQRMADLDAHDKDDDSAQPEPVPGYWKAVVAGPNLFCPKGLQPMWVYREWRHDLQCFDSRQIRLIDIPRAPYKKIHAHVTGSTGHMVEVKVDISDLPYQQNMRALNKLAAGPTNEWSKRMIQLLTLKPEEARGLLRGNIYETVADQGAVEETLDLNDRQKRAIKLAQRTPLKISLVSGPPGTGKSYLARKSIVPFLKTEENLKVLICAPSNTAADSLARDIHDQIEELHRDQAIHENVHVIRLHARAAEESVIRHVMLGRMQKPGSTANTSTQPKASQSAANVGGQNSKAQSVFRTQLESETIRQYDNIDDPRVREIKLSTGYRMMEMAGRASVAQLFSDWDEYNECLNLVLKGIPLTDEQKTTYEEEQDALFRATLRAARVVVTTTYNAGSERLLQAIKDQVVLVIIDEAARERDDNLLAIFSAGFDRNPGLMMIGDSQQLGPAVMMSKRYDDYPHLRSSLFTRLRECGFPSCQLLVQNRMVPTICWLANHLFYGTQLQSGPATKPEGRPKALAFQRYAEKHSGCKKPTNVVVLDFEKYRYNCTNSLGDGRSQERGSGSKFNEFFVVQVANMLPAILSIDRTASVAVLTPYTAQRNNYLIMKNAMVTANVAGVDRLTISTFDSSQGNEFDYVIVDLPIDSSLGFYRETERVNVALTRARNGMIVILDTESFRKALGNSERMGRLEESCITINNLLNWIVKFAGYLKHDAPKPAEGVEEPRPYSRFFHMSGRY